MNKSESIAALAKALAAAQGEIKHALKKAKNPYYNSAYADLAEVMDACRGPLVKNGLAVLQPVSGDGKVVTITTMLVHESGEWISSDLVLAPKDGGPQAMGSAISYGRRYALAAMVGVAADADDDGNAAEGKRNEPKSAARPQQAEVIPMPKPDNGNGKPAAGVGSNRQAIIDEIMESIKRRAGADKKAKLETIKAAFGCDWAGVLQLEEPKLLAGLAKLN